jgi:fucose permease
MAAGMLLMAAGVAAIVVAPWPGVAAAMGTAGVGLGFVIPSMNLLVARLEPARASAALSALNLSWGAGAMSWPVTIAILQPMLGAAAVLVALAGVLAAGAVRLAVIRPDPAAVQERAVVARSSPAGMIVLFAALIVAYSGVEMAIGGWVTEYGRRIAEMPSARTGQFAAAMFWAGLTLGRAGIAWRLTDRRADPALFVGLAVVAAALTALLTLPASLLAAGALCAGIGMAPVFPVTIAAVARTCSPRVASALIATAALGGATIPWIVGAVSAATGSLTLGLATLLALVLLLAGGHTVRVRTT